MWIFSRQSIPNEIHKEPRQQLYVLTNEGGLPSARNQTLVERFNGTLKAMLRKAAIEDGKDWDKLLPYLLFAYREVPQTFTGFSLFELLFGGPVRGPLDMLKEYGRLRRTDVRV